MLCEHCQHEARDGYRVDPETGRITEGRFWCRACYETIHSRTSRDAYRTSGKRPDDHAN